MGGKRVNEMNDILLLETCPKCGKHITLMESINTDNQELWLVKRCLSCGQYPVVEIVEIRDQIKLQAAEDKLARIEKWAKEDPMSSSRIIFMTTEAEAGYELAQEVVDDILSGGE